MHHPAEPLSPEVAASLNPGIRKLVPLLRAQGFDTVNSGDGRTHDCTCDLPHPFVYINVHIDKATSETFRCIDVLNTVLEKPLSPEELNSESGRTVELMFAPMADRDYATIGIFNVLDEHLKVEN